MPTYVTLVTWTDQGIRGVKDTVRRAQAFSEAAARMNCRVHEILWTMGSYDLVGIVEAPDDQAASRIMLSLGMQGNVRTLTMRAFRREEMEEILRGLP